DQLASVLGERAGAGDHGDDRLTDEANLVRGQQPAGHRLDVVAGDRGDERGDVGQVLSGEHRDHTVEGPGRLGIDPDDAGVRVGAADEGDVQHAPQVDVVDVAAPAHQVPAVLDPRHPGADVLGVESVALVDLAHPDSLRPVPVG